MIREKVKDVLDFGFAILDLPVIKNPKSKIQNFTRLCLVQCDG